MTDRSRRRSRTAATLAELEITAPGLEPRRVPLLAGEEMQAAGLLGRMSSALGYLIWGPS